MWAIERESGKKRDGILFVLRLAGDQRTLDLVTHAQLEMRRNTHEW